MNMVQLGIQYFPDITTGRPVSLGSVYIGVADLDPQILANQLPVSLKLEDGSFVSVGQPLLTGAGGVVLYDGSPAQIFVAGNHSIKVLNSSGSQVYYIPNNDEAFVASDISLRDTTLLAMDDFDRSILFTDGDGFTAGAGPHVFTVTGDYTPTDSDFRTYKMDVNGVITTIVVTGQTGTQFTYAGTLAATDIIFVGDDTNRELATNATSSITQNTYTQSAADAKFLQTASYLQEIEDAGSSAQTTAREHIGLMSPDVAGFVKTFTHYHVEDGGLGPYDAGTNITANSAFESVGPTGSSADNIWADMDVLPSYAKYVEIRVLCSAITIAGESEMSISIFGRATGSAATKGDGTQLGNLDIDVSTVTNIQNQFIVKIPLDGSLRFDFSYNMGGNNSNLVSFYLSGFGA